MALSSALPSAERSNLSWRSILRLCHGGGVWEPWSSSFVGVGDAGVVTLEERQK